MKNTSFSPATNSALLRTFVVFALVAGIALSGAAISGFGQAQELSLADIIVALRSKKATLPEKNKILADAVQTRGTTFTLTPEIEKELEGTGAESSLIDSIRQRAAIAKLNPSTQPAAEPLPKVETPPPPMDFSSYEKRADASLAKGDLDAAMMDYTRAIEMQSNDVTALLGRATTYMGKNSFTLAIADYTKVIEIEPKNTAVYERRAAAQEKKGNVELALADYRKVVDLDPSNDAAKKNIDRLDPPKPKVVEPVKVEPTPAPPVVKAPVLPEFVVLGQLNESMATRVVKPVYPQFALKSAISGRVTVEIEIDTAGNVMVAKTVSGNPNFRQSCEEAAKKWKFKPTMVGATAVKAKGFLTFNFVPAK